MRFTYALWVQLLKVNSSSKATITFFNDHHGAAPDCWITNWYRLYFTILNISVQISFGLFSPVNGNWDGVWIAEGTAPSLRWMCAGLKFISGNGVDKVKTEENSLSRCCFNVLMFCSVEGTGMVRDLREFVVLEWSLDCGGVFGLESLSECGLNSATFSFTWRWFMG